MQLLLCEKQKQNIPLSNATIQGVQCKDKQIRYTKNGNGHETWSGHLFCSLILTKEEAQKLEEKEDPCQKYDNRQAIVPPKSKDNDNFHWTWYLYRNGGHYVVACIPRALIAVADGSEYESISWLQTHYNWLHSLQSQNQQIGILYFHTYFPKNFSLNTLM